MSAPETQQDDPLAQAQELCKLMRRWAVARRTDFRFPLHEGEPVPPSMDQQEPEWVEAPSYAEDATTELRAIDPDQDIEHYTRLVYDQGRWDLAPDLASAYLRKALTLKDRGEAAEALPLVRWVVQYYQSLVGTQAGASISEDLGRAHELLAELEARTALGDDDLELLPMAPL